jgi:hypothetical protein
MRDAIGQYYADKNKYPASLQDLVRENYLREVPKDPRTGSAATWNAVPAKPDPDNPASNPGVYDVKSGAGATALGGSKIRGLELNTGTRGSDRVTSNCSMTSSTLRSSRFSITVAMGRRVLLNTEAPLTLPGILSTGWHWHQS